MRILIAAMAVDIGGAETHIVTLVRDLKDRGHDVCVVSAGGVYEKDINECGAEHRYAPLNSRSPAAMLKAYFIVRGLIKDYKPDVVHGHARIPSFICGLIRKTSRMNFAFVTTAHWVFKVTPLTKLLTDWGDRCLAVSEDIIEYLIDNYNYPKRRINLTANGIDTEKFSPEINARRIIRSKLNIPEDAPMLLTISRLDNTAGEAARVLTNNAVLLTREIPGLRIVITGADVVGSGFGDMIRAEAEAANIEIGYNAVILTGARSDIPEVLSACDVFVGVSRAALEALACAKPVVLAGGEGYLGIFTKENAHPAQSTNLTCRGCGAIDNADFVQSVVRLFRAPEQEIRELSLFGRDFICENYPSQRIGDDAMRVYNSALSGGKTVTMCGYYGHGNLGDEVVMKCVRDSVYEAGADKIIVLSKNPKETRGKYGVESVNRFNPFSVFRALRHSDTMVFGGGSLLQDGTSKRSLIYYLTILKMAGIAKCKTMIYANGIGPLRSTYLRRKAAEAVRRCDAVTLRDERSKAELSEMGVIITKMEVTADPAFAVKPPPITYSAPYAVIVPRAASAEYSSELRKLAVLFERHGIETKFLVLQQSDEYAVPDVVPAAGDEILSLLAGARIVVSMRLHALIFAACFGVPAAGIDIDPKITAFLEEMQLPNLGSIDFNAESAFTQISDLLSRREEASEALLSKVDEKRLKLSRDTQILRGLLKKC